MIHRIGVLGAGAWGLTLADLLARKGNAVTVWDIDAPLLASLAADRVCPKLPGLALSPSLLFRADLAKAVEGADILLCAVPSFAVRPLCERLLPDVPDLTDRLMVCVSKGIEENSLKLPSQVVEEFYGAAAMQSFVALSGPSHAEEVSRGIPTVVVSSSFSAGAAERVRDLFILPEFRVYTQSDTRGVELGAALKNVIAIAAGACDGLGFGDNTKAALVTRGLAEITRMGVALGASALTFSGLAGLGDLVVTAMSRHSRNRKFGELIAGGLSVTDALREVGQVVEGYRTSRSAHQLGLSLGVETPLTDVVYAVLHEGADLRTSVAALLTRDPKPEIY